MCPPHCLSHGCRSTRQPSGNTPHEGQEIECEKKIEHPGNCQNERSHIESDSFQQVLSCEGHLAVVLVKNEERFIIKYKAIHFLMTSHILLSWILKKTAH